MPRSIRLAAYATLLVTAAAANGHGTQIEGAVVPGIRVQAQYDTGEPMAEAQVIVYAPEQPAHPWLTATTDHAGVFQFVPDPAQLGTWAVQVRQAGHGAMLNLPVLPTETVSHQITVCTNHLSRTQQWLMALAVVWGLIGTALFFYRQRGANASS